MSLPPQRHNMNSLTQIFQFFNQTCGDFQAFFNSFFFPPQRALFNAAEQQANFALSCGLDYFRDTMVPPERHQVGTLAAVFHLANQFATDFY